MSVKHEMVTAEALWEMPDPPGKRLELVDGEVVEVSPTTILHGVIVLPGFTGRVGDLFEVSPHR